MTGSVLSAEKGWLNPLGGAERSGSPLGLVYRPERWLVNLVFLGVNLYEWEPLAHDDGLCGL